MHINLSKRMEMSNNDDITFEELAGNRAFRNWVLNPTKDASIFWEQWSNAEEGRSELMDRARLLVLALDEQFRELTDDQMIQADLQKLINRAKDHSKENILTEKRRTGRISGYIWRVAASLVLLGSFGIWYWQKQQTAVPEIVKVYSGEEEAEWLSKKNTTDQTQTVLLNDGTVVMLEKHSELTYPSTFSGKNRAVYLSGDAFFDVTKDPKKPFLVFAGQTVTKVLGTSFRVRAFERDGDVLVAVKTGKVSVYAQDEFAKAESNDDSASSVVLAPNEEVLFSTKVKKNEKEIISDLEILASMPDEDEVVFEERPVSEIFQSLEKKYGIEIIYNESKLSSCTLTTVFKEEGLKQRLNAICTALGGTYSVEGEKVVIHATDGCKQ